MFNLYFYKILRYPIYETRRALDKKEVGKVISFNIYCLAAGTEVGSKDIVVNVKDILPALNKVWIHIVCITMNYSAMELK